MRTTIAATGSLALLALAACTSSGEDAATADPPASTADAAPSTEPGTTGAEETTEVVGTVVRFSSGSDSVDVQIDEDSAATRDFLSMLPLELELEEFSGREKIAYLPRELEYGGSPGSDPEDGDLIYFVPWGNLGFYYNTEGVDYSDQTLHLGVFDASLDELEALEGDVTVAIVAADRSSQ
jgi:hypothetical protein